MTPEPDHQAKHGYDAHPREQRGRRIRWRSVTLGLFALLVLGTWWLEARTGWDMEVTLGVVAIPYWAAVTAIWRLRGPEMPGL